jgi:hypothetical protein
MQKITLPVGVKSGGQRYREVVVDEMRGTEEEALMSSKVKSNFAKALTKILQRCIQEIPGLVPMKKQKDLLLDEDIIKKMDECDRMACLIEIFKLEDDVTTDVDFSCGCGEKWSETYDLNDLPMEELQGEPEIRFELKKGIEFAGRLLKNGTMRFPRGDDMEALASLARENPGEAQTKLLFLCVTDLEGESGVTSNTFRLMSKRDREYLSKLLDSKVPGYDLAIKRTCPSCGKEASTQINIASFLFGTRE